MDFILGTAGHIDHGKTSLIRALTGIDCDRLEEEKRRGITIELGFAWLDMPDGQRMGIVDVPGHERFVKNMVAGATGIDCVLLVVAADEGVMPQTREHLEICSLLGVSSGIVALTKTDLVDPELLKMAADDVSCALKGSFLENSSIIPVSTVTGEGLDNLRKAIYVKFSSLRRRSASDIFRLPIDRAFIKKGFGLIVTGTVASGNCSQGEKVTVFPASLPARVRGLQSHNSVRETVGAGQRCAMNLQGVETLEVKRGDVVAHEGTLFPVKNWYIRLHCLKSSPLPIRQRMEVHFHHGTKECEARIIFRDRDFLAPGESTLAEVKFSEPMAAIYNDHCVLRAHSPLRSIGGGVVTCPLPPKLSKRQKDYEDKLELLRRLGEPDKENPLRLARKPASELAEICLELCGVPGANMRQLAVMTGLPHAELKAGLAEIAEKGGGYCWDNANGQWISRKGLESCIRNCEKRAKELHLRDPRKSFFAPNTFFAGWGENLPPKLAREILDLAVKAGILVEEGTGYRLGSHQVSFSAEEKRMLETLAAKIKAGSFKPPFIKEILEEQNWDAKKAQPLLDYLCNTDKLLKIQENFYYDKEEFKKLLDAVFAWFEKHEELDIASAREVLGISRKYAIPLLEYLDASHVTIRVNDKRRLRKRSGETARNSS